MAVTAPRLLRVRCTRWDQVESFLRKKLRADGRLSMKVPFDAEPGAAVTLTIELPNQIVIALDGAVAKAEAHERPDATVVQLAGAKHAIDRLEAMLTDARAGGEGGDLAATLSVREAELRRLRQQAAHEVLGVSRTPTLVELRRAWRLRARREHPDAVARFGSAALRLTAEEAMIVVTRAYERLRDTVCAEKRAVIAGTSVRTIGSIALEVAPSESFEVVPLTPPIAEPIELRPTPTPPPPRPPARITAPMPVASLPPAAPRATTPPPIAPPPVELPQLLDTDADTLDGFDRPMSRPLALDLDLPPPPPPRPPRSSRPPEAPPQPAAITLTPAVVPAPATVEQSLRQARSGPGDRFVRAVHDRLALADHAGAAQIAAAAHQVYPLDQRLRALIEVAAAQAACAHGDRTAAIAALQTALTIDPDGTEARRALAAVTGAMTVDPTIIQDRFR